MFGFSELPGTRAKQTGSESATRADSAFVPYKLLYLKAPEPQSIQARGQGSEAKSDQRGSRALTPDGAFDYIARSFARVRPPHISFLA
ncbi:hypothetical protein ABID41_003634 [Phenylobacterium koreense]|uniref:Uncharacterized protein n=1 Tax=Phenylobacterium koreense TaxID=266125 RepID=A0ABV2EN53_9CAUL